MNVLFSSNYDLTCVRQEVWPTLTAQLSEGDHNCIVFVWHSQSRRRSKDSHTNIESKSCCFRQTSRCSHFPFGKSSTKNPCMENLSFFLTKVIATERSRNNYCPPFVIWTASEPSRWLDVLMMQAPFGSGKRPAVHRESVALLMHLNGFEDLTRGEFVRRFSKSGVRGNLF